MTSGLSNAVSDAFQRYLGNFLHTENYSLKFNYLHCQNYINQLIEITIFCEYILLRKKLPRYRWNASDTALESPDAILYDLYIT